MISRIGIANFKSIKNLDLDCKRINIFIGKPNVGKSNILESLYFGNIYRKGELSGIRFEAVRNLFYDQDINNSILITLDKIVHYTKYTPRSDTFRNIILDITNNPLFDNQDIIEYISDKLDASDNLYKSISNPKGYSKLTNQGNFNQRVLDPELIYPKIKKYSFRKNDKTYTNTNKLFYEESLSEPNGDNLFELLKNNHKLLLEASELFKHYGYNLIIDFVSNKAEIQKVIGNLSYKIPYTLVADTLQRMIFYLAAIRTNNNCAILLEEPENHSFPPYIRDIAFEIINATTNQFFIATHSPYLINTLMAEANKDELAINIVSYSDFETKVKTLSNDEIAELSNSGVDLFFNIDMFA